MTVPVFGQIPYDRQPPSDRLPPRRDGATWAAAADAPTLGDQLEDLVCCVWACEDDWRFDDAIAVRAKNEGW